MFFAFSKVKSLQCEVVDFHLHCTFLFLQPTYEHLITYTACKYQLLIWWSKCEFAKAIVKYPDRARQSDIQVYSSICHNKKDELMFITCVVGVIIAPLQKWLYLVKC